MSHLPTPIISAALLLGSTASAVELSQPFALDPLSITVRLGGDPPGVERWMMIDTGTNCIAIDKDSMPLLSPEKVADDFSASSITMHLGDWIVPARLPATSLNLALMREAGGFNLVGMIGTPAFAASILDIDPDADAVRILPASVSDPARDSFTRLPLSFHHDLPYINVLVEGFSTELMVDTGCDDEVELAAALYQALLARGRIEAIGTTNAATANGTSTQRTGTVAALSIAGFLLPRSRVMEDAEPRIGMRFLRRFRCLLDFGGGALYLRPNAEFATYRPNASDIGIELHWIHGRVMAKVTDDSIAYNCGFRSGFRILAVGGHPVLEIGTMRTRLLIGGREGPPVEVQALDLDDHPVLLTVRKNH